MKKDQRMWKVSISMKEEDIRTEDLHVAQFLSVISTTKSTAEMLTAI